MNDVVCCIGIGDIILGAKTVRRQNIKILYWFLQYIYTREIQYVSQKYITIETNQRSSSCFIQLTSSSGRWRWPMKGRRHKKLVLIIQYWGLPLLLRQPTATITIRAILNHDLLSPSHLPRRGTSRRPVVRNIDIGIPIFLVSKDDVIVVIIGNTRLLERHGTVS